MSPAPDALDPGYGSAMTETRGPGRPEVGPKVTFRLPEETCAMVNSLADASQMSRSQWLRDLVEREIRKLTR